MIITHRVGIIHWAVIPKSHVLLIRISSVVMASPVLIKP